MAEPNSFDYRNVDKDEYDSIVVVDFDDDAGNLDGGHSFADVVVADAAAALEWDLTLPTLV